MLIFPKAMELWNRNFYIDLNGNLQNLKTEQIKSRVFSNMFLTSISICVVVFFFLILASFMIR